MNSSGRISLNWVSVLTLLMAGLFVGATADAQLPDSRSATASSFYTSFGRLDGATELGGPYIIAATWDPDGDGGDGELRLIFSEAVDATTFEDPDGGDDNYDFLPIGFDWRDGVMPDEVAVLDIPSAGDQRVVALRGFSDTNPPQVGDAIALSSIDDFGDDWTDGIDGADGATSINHTRVPVITGPVAVSVALSADWLSTPVAEGDLAALDIIIEFDTDMVVPAVTVENIFDLTPELADFTDGATPTDFFYAAGPNPNELVVTWSADNNFRYLRPGWSKLWLRAGLLEWDTATGAVNVAQNVMLNNDGPVLLGAQYIAARDEIWLTFDEPIDPDFLIADLAGTPQYTLAGGAAAWGGSESQALGFTEGFPNCVRIVDTGFTWDALATLEVDNGAATVISDHQGVAGPAGQPAIDLDQGLLILRASYDEGGAGIADDVLRILFSETIFDVGAIGASDFEFVPAELDAAWNDVDLVVSHATQGDHSVVEVSGWDGVDLFNGGRLPEGTLLKLDAAADIRGFFTSLQGANTAVTLPVVDDVIDWPTVPMAEEVTDMIKKYYNPVGPVDEAYLAWQEPGPDDLVDEWLLYTTDTETNLTQSLITDYADQATPISNLRSQVYDSGEQIFSVDIAVGTSTTDGAVLADGDEVWFMIVPAMYTGSIGPEATALKFGAPIVVGPPCPPIDFLADLDDDMIHVRAVLNEVTEEWSYIIWGDAGSAPCGDSVFVSDDAVAHLEANRLGAALIAGNRSWGPITLDMPDPAESEIYCFSRLEGQDVWSATSEDITVDTVDPTIVLWNNGTNDVIRYADRFNPLQIYTEGSYVNILCQAYDGVDGDATALSDLMEIYADFSEINEGAAVTGVPDVTMVPFVSMGADAKDNDGDWVAEDPASDVDLDSVMDFPEPYFDEDGDGLFTPGETFVDVDGNGLCDAPRTGGVDPAAVEYDLMLDSADPDEHGFYEIQLTADFNDVTKGFPIEDAVTDPTMGFGELMMLEVFVSVVDTTYDATTAYDGVDEDPAFFCEVDEVAPTECEIAELQVTGGLAIDPATVPNLIVPTDPTYHLGRFVNIMADTDSDDDVLFGVAQIYANRNGGGWVWESLSLDPSGDNADAGFPGVADFDDDGDATGGGGALTDGADNDEDGTVDEDGEGTDTADTEVTDASQDSTQNAAAGIDGIWRQTDTIDNDNDAFYTFEPYFDGGANTFQRVIFYNIDESVTNDADDDGDGAIDESDEVETYDSALDDNEDGIIDGEAMELTADGGFIVTAFDDTYAGTFYVDAAHILGSHAGDSDGDINPMTEFIEPAEEILNDNLVPWAPGFPGMDWGMGDQVNTEFSWYDTHGENIDFEYFAALYDLVADGSTEYQARVVAYDQIGLFNADYAHPIVFTLDITWPEDLVITNCDDGDVETGPADFADVVPDDDVLQVYDDADYTLTTENDDDAAEVLFQYRESTDSGVSWGPGGGTYGAADGWDDLSTWDDSRPFTDEYTAAALDNDPPANSLMVEFRAVPKDEFGNTPDLDAAMNPDSVCIFPVTIIDGTPPMTAFTMIWDVVNQTGPDPVDPAGPYDAYWYRDTYGPVQVPAGPVIDVWAWYDDMDGVDETNDVARMIFEYREVGSDPDADWTYFATVTGTVVVDPASGDTLDVDLTIPVAVNLDTETLGTGSYDIRVYGCDIEGNCNITTADIATIVIVEEGLRAYIQPPFVSATATLELYAFNYLHDETIDYVTFQYAEEPVAPDDYVWITVGIDGDPSDRGDVLFHIGSFTPYYELEGLAAAARHLEFNADELFWDPDEDGYSERDPIIQSANGTYETANDAVLLGDEPPEGATLTAFPATFFHTDDIDDDEFSGATEWVFEHNAAEGDNAELDMWHVQWDVSGLNGAHVARAVATDIYSATDEGDIPTVPVIIDPEPPYATITLVTLPDGTTLDPDEVPSLYVEGSHGWFMLTVECDAPDLALINYEYSINGGVDWTGLDVNDDNDFFADINDMVGFQMLNAPGVPWGDEIFIDDGDFVYGEGDIPLYDGGDMEVNTPLGHVLIPLTTEDPAGGGDTDGDELDGEDPMELDDRDAPFVVYFYIADLPFVADGDVFFRAVAEDQTGNSDPDGAEVISILVGESEPPVTDLIWAKTPDGTELDVWQAISDGDGVALIGSNPDDLTLSIFVTAEDNDISGPLTIDLAWRYNPDCYPELEPWENPWMSAADGGFTTLDATPPEYTFTLDLQGLVDEYGDASIVFFPQAADQGGNVTPPPVNPYALRIMTNEAFITTALPATVAPGVEFTFEAELAMPVEGATVSFYYAPRILDVEIDATRVSQATPYIAPDLEVAAAANPGCHFDLYINDELATYHEDLSLVSGPTKMDYTVNGTAQVEFGAPVDPSDVILADYNIDGYDPINTGDSYPPYTVAWDYPTGVPEPPANCEAYDIIAIADLGVAEGDECALTEAMCSEGMLLYLVGDDAPVMGLYMKGGRNAAPGDYYPGNPSFDSIAGTTEWKMSGIEHEVFAVHEDGDEPVSVDLMLVDAAGAETTVPMVLFNEEQTTVPMTFTFYAADYIYVGLWIEDPIENVWLRLDEVEYEMTMLETGIWQVTDVPVPVGATTEYDYYIDMVGDDVGAVMDARNQHTPVPAGVVSDVVVPDTPFWFASLGNESPVPAESAYFGTETAVWQVKLIAESAEGYVGYTAPLLMVYDPVPPTIDEFTLGTPRTDEFQDVWCQVSDPVPGDFDIITVTEVVWEVCVNYDAPEADHVWFPWGQDGSPVDGWHETLAFLAPDADSFDNNGDGRVDEPEETTVTVGVRAWARDDGYNLSAPVMLTFILDTTDPEAVVTSPLNGAVFPFNGGPFEITAVITDTEEDIAFVQFQFNSGGGWTNIDITPEWDGDDPFDAEPPYAVMFDPIHYLTEMDTYVRIRAQAEDTAGNADGDAPEILIAINDTEGPAALPMFAKTTGGADWMALADPHTAITGDAAQIRVALVDPTATEGIERVDLEFDDGESDAWILIASLEGDDITWSTTSTGTVDFPWDVTGLAEGTYPVRAWAFDIDGNPLSEDPVMAYVVVDHTGPAVVYVPMGTDFAGFVNSALYENDGTPEQSSVVIVPDPITGDVTFLIATPDANVAAIALEYQLQPDGPAPGDWDAWDDSFDYEPNLNFTYEDTSYHVWRLLVHNWVDAAGALDGIYAWRALAMDYAGNANGLHDENNPWTLWTVDTGDPTAVSLSHNLQADQVESGESVTFYFEGTEMTTDIVSARFEWRYVGGTWAVVDPDPDTPEIEVVPVTSANIDTEFPRWYAEVTWETPFPLVQDMTVEFRTVFYDAGGNEAFALRAAGEDLGGPIVVEDNIAPDNTQLVYLSTAAVFVDYDDAGYDDDCENGDHDALFLNLGGGATTYEAGTDIAIDYGQDGTLLTNGAAGAAIGAADNIWPRWVDEDVIEGTLPITVANSVFLVARTQGADTGIERVEFYVENSGGEMFLVGVDECVPAYANFGASGGLWQCIWNTEDTDNAGAVLYPDGEYTVYVMAWDLEGNVEIMDAYGSRDVTVDNTAPEATPDADALTEEVDVDYGTIERNGTVQLFARTDTEVDDDEVTFYFKRSDDLNTGAEWSMVLTAWGVDDNDVNGDDTRPYVFDWDLNKTPDLVRGVSYDVACTTMDIVGNGESHVDAFDDERFVTFTLTDTMAPCATITEIARETGDTTPIVWPHLYDAIYARDLDYVEATILDYAADADFVEFMFVPEGGTTPTLIDVAVEEVAAYTWRISNWDLSALTPGVVYDVFAVAYDVFGNADLDEETGRPTCGPAFKLVYDNTAPSFEADLNNHLECAQDGFGFSSYPSCWRHGHDEVPAELTGPSLSECGRVVPFGYYAAGGDVYDIDIIDYGDVGEATFRWRVDGGDWSGTLTTAAQVLLEEGVYVGFVDGAPGHDSFDDADFFTFTTSGKIYDLIFTSTDVDIDRDRIFWEYKLSAEPDGDEYWMFDRMNGLVLYDGQTQQYSTSWDVAGLTGLYDLRLTVYDLAGNRHTMIMAENVVLDGASPSIDITNIVIHDPEGGDDTTIDPVDFGTVIDVTAGDVLELWVTANDDDELLPADRETGITQVIFEVWNEGDNAWRELGFWHAPSETEVPLEVVASQLWNTSGLGEGMYTLRAWAEDERCNQSYSMQVTINVLDQVPPRARIAAFDPWQEDHGDDLTTYCDIHAIAYSDSDISQVQFQYLDGDEWIPIGIATDYESDCGDSPDEGRGDLWYTTIDLGMFDVGQTITFRAIATDDTPNQDPNPPTIDATVVAYEDGSLNLDPVGGLGMVAGIDMVMEGGDDPNDINVTVRMHYATQYPHVMYTPPLPASLGGGPCWVEMTRHIGADADTMWTGQMDIDESECGKFEIFANGLVDNGIDMMKAHVWTWEVDDDLGTNGTAMVPGYLNMDTEEVDYLYATAFVPSGLGHDWTSCFTLFPTDSPMMNVDQERFLIEIDRTCYFIGMPDDYNDDIDEGYWPQITIDYDEAALAEALGEDWAEKEQYLTVRVWDSDDGHWEGEDISHIEVDPVNNVVHFTVQYLDYDWPFYAIFAPAAEAPVVVESYFPSSVRYGRWNWTDADPVITAMLYAGGVEEIDSESVELWIDGQLYATDDWVRGGHGHFEINQANNDGTIYEVIYCHSYYGGDLLVEGEHTLNILYKHLDGLDEWIELSDTAPGATFYVDNTSPYLEFHGGWVSNPLFSNVSGYLNPAQNNMLTVKMFDNGTGIYVRPDHVEWVWDCNCFDDLPPTPWDAAHPETDCNYYYGDYDEGCWVEVDWGIKYDLWLVEHGCSDCGNEDDQSDIDEIEERLLLHQGTADELLPYLQTINPEGLVESGYASYGPEDTLLVRLPIVGGGLIEHNDILEVTIYTTKTIDQSHGGDDYYQHAAVDTLILDGGDVVYLYYDTWYDTHSQELHEYTGGVLDYAWNMGSQYIEQRFIVDMEAPTATLLSPAGGQAAPGEGFTFKVKVEDPAGLADVSAVLRGPDGEVIENIDITIENGMVTGTVPDGLAPGNYTVEVTMTDMVGNTTVVSIPITTDSGLLALTETYVYPNPFDPDDVEAMVHFNLSRKADMTFKVYDFAGEYVGTLDPMSYDHGGSYVVPWAGHAADGTPLANGAYMIHVQAHDGSATKATTLKAVIWRE